MGYRRSTSEMLTRSFQSSRKGFRSCGAVASAGWYRLKRMADSHRGRHRLSPLRSTSGDSPSHSTSNLALAVVRGVDGWIGWVKKKAAIADRSVSSFVRCQSLNLLKGRFDSPSGDRDECQRVDYAYKNVRTAAIFACKDGGIGVDPEPRLRRPVTPLGVGTILDGTGTGGGLEIVESG